MNYEDYKTLKRALALVEGANRQMIHLDADVAKYNKNDKLKHELCDCIEGLNKVRDILLSRKFIEKSKLKKDGEVWEK